MLRLRDIKYLNKSLIVIVLILYLFGLFFIYSASYASGKHMHFVTRQIMWMVVGLVVFWLVVSIDFHYFASLAYVIYFTNIILLIAVLIIGKVHLGAQRWFRIGSIAFQPSEITKITIILVVARFLSDHSEQRSRITFIFVPFILVILPVFLIIKQPDLGTAIIFLPLLFMMLFVAGAKIKYLLSIVLLAISSVPFLWMFLHDYQKMRILVFINPNADPLGSGYTAIQSKIAVGSGGLAGLGWLQGTQNRLKFLPERHTDFIFSVIGEEIGFIGCVILLVLFALLLFKCVKVSEIAGNSFGRILGLGITAMIFIHIVINVGMTVGLMPVTGLPLPFISYGGSFLVTMMVSLGLLENIYMRRPVF
ncbi:rod shape-determining protein RodA [Chlamydiota bacterium]